MNVPIHCWVEVKVLGKDRDVKFKDWCEVDDGKRLSVFGELKHTGWRTSRGTSIICTSVFSTHYSVHHELVNEIREVMARRLLVLVQESFICSLCFLECLDGHCVVLEDNFLENLVKNLFLEAEDRLAAGHAYCFGNHKGTFLAKQNLFEVHTCQILLLSQVVRSDKVEERASADRVTS